MTLMNISTIPKPAFVLGFSGLIPFFGLAAAAVLAGDSLRLWAEQALIGYGAVILSFMAGCRWGFAAAGLGDGPDWRPFILSVLPSLYAWAVVVTPAPLPGLWLAAGFGVLYWMDAYLTNRGGAPVWWARLRLPLSAGAVLALVVPYVPGFLF